MQVTGSATITSFGTGFSGCRREVRFAAPCGIVHSSNILLPNGVNVTTAANDILIFRCTGAGQWFLCAQSRPSGTSLDYVLKTGDTMSGALSTTAITSTGGTFVGSAGSAIMGPSAASGSILLRPNGTGSSSGQFVVANDGAASSSGDVRSS